MSKTASKMNITAHQDPLSDIPSIDPSAILRLEKMGGTVFVVKMIDLFLANAPEKINSMKEAIRKKEYELLERAAHSLKSSAGNFGAAKLQQMAENIETFAPTERTNHLTELVDLLMNESPIVLDYLKNKKSEYKK